MVAERIVFENTPDQSTLEAVAASSDGRVRWTSAQYHAMGELGWFDERRVELIGGEIFQKSPIGDRHWISVNRTDAVLRRVFASGYIISAQSSLKLSEISEPEPDVAVIEGDIFQIRSVPTTAALAVEVADSTLRRDRLQKSSLYAASGIDEYWIVDLVNNRLIVHRTPIEKADEPFGWNYALVQTLTSGQSVAPLSAPDATVEVADLLP